MSALLEVEALEMRFGGVRAVAGVSFSVEQGEVFTLIGPNGAGKTTVFNLISRLYTPTAGAIRFEGRDLLGVPAHRVARLGVARTFQNIELFEHASVLHNLLIGRHVHRRTALWQEMLFTPAVRRAERAFRERVERVIDLLELQHHRDSLVAGLPYGVRKVVELGRALAVGPKLLLLDEPSAGLAPVVVQSIFGLMKTIRAQGFTVLIVEQNIQQVLKVVDRAYLLETGRIRQSGDAATLLASDEIRRAYLGV
ncbi:MAG: ABC transporter ATP-binding protein [Betaproteobacteria bacterium]